MGPTSSWEGRSLLTVLDAGNGTTFDGLPDVCIAFRAHDFGNSVIIIKRKNIGRDLRADTATDALFTVQGHNHAPAPSQRRPIIAVAAVSVNPHETGIAVYALLQES